MIEVEKEWFWFREMNQQPHQELGESDDHPIPENGDDMQEDTPEERLSELLDALTERVTSLEKRKRRVEEGRPGNGSEDGAPSKGHHGNCRAILHG